MRRAMRMTMLRGLGGHSLYQDDQRFRQRQPVSERNFSAKNGGRQPIKLHGRPGHEEYQLPTDRGASAGLAGPASSLPGSSLCATGLGISGQPVSASNGFQAEAIMDFPLQQHWQWSASSEPLHGLPLPSVPHPHAPLSEHEFSTIKSSPNYDIESSVLSPAAQRPTPASMAVLLNQTTRSEAKNSPQISFRSLPDGSHTTQPPSTSTTKHVEGPQSPSEPIPHHEDSLIRERKHACTMCHKRFDRPSTLKKVEFVSMVRSPQKLTNVTIALPCSYWGKGRCVLKPVNATSAAGNTEHANNAGGSSTNASATPPSPSHTLSSNSSDKAGSPGRISYPHSHHNKPPGAPKRRRRAPSPSRWVPPSLAHFNLAPPESVHGGDAPGTAGVTTHRVLIKDRTFVDELHYKGWSLKLGDWVHLSNPDDPSRPIVAQVFRCWISDESYVFVYSRTLRKCVDGRFISAKKGQPGLTVSWYYRPEQTFHPSNRIFWEGEVFKTSHFADHPLEDIIEKIACQFTARHVRGRPRPPFWYLGFPLYVCDSRYNDRDRAFVRIKNWNSCVPEEVRKSVDFMPIYPFERNVFPSQVPSPFLSRGVKGPGGLVPAETTEHTANDTQAENIVGGRTLRTRKTATEDRGGSAKGYVGASSQSILPSASLTNLHTTQPPRPPGPDRSVLTAAGALAVGAHTEKLPHETAKHFDRDPTTNEVLWFSAAPVDIARPTKPKYSLAYLHFLANKRKRELADPESDDHENDPKRERFDAPPTVMETLVSAWRKINAEEV
ncbi:hypothetical protein H0H93_005447 [Arthromyces matolae]|nr:hypothetical protein H0H93_005447 [Arthromyces matolae]